jgi:two-component system OmpR family response regulator
MPSLLVVEDNDPLTKSLSDWLGAEYRIDIIKTGAGAVSKAKNNKYAVIILDLGLPDIPGEKVCRDIREEGIDSPVLVLTGINTVQSKIEVLDCGADDFLCKPFHIGELQARLRALARRPYRTYTRFSPLTVGDLKLEPGRRTVSRGGVQITLRRKEFDILEYLIRNQGTVVTRSMILSNVWDSGTERWNNTVDVHIKYLRDKIDKPFAEKLIKTSYGSGYIIESDSAAGLGYGYGVERQL